jgi:uncharacterized damage-inducible protein DinB
MAMADATGSSGSGGSIREFYKGWKVYNDRVAGVIREMTAKQLAIRPAPDLLPIWATVGHMAGGRVYWLCGVFKEPGAEATPFPDPFAETGWEDDLDTPRSAEELVDTLDSTWKVVAGCLDRWTPEMLRESFDRDFFGTHQTHTRQSVLMRLLTHDAYHAGELSQTLGIHGLPQIDLWRPPQPGDR